MFGNAMYGGDNFGITVAKFRSALRDRLNVITTAEEAQALFNKCVQ